jgi:hypothetical protein
MNETVKIEGFGIKIEDIFNLMLVALVTLDREILTNMKVSSQSSQSRNMLREISATSIEV